VNTNSQLQSQLSSIEETGPLFQEHTNIAITQNSLLLENIKDFFYWWYIQMPLYYLLSIRRINIVLVDFFSIKLLIRNFFTPWQRKYTPQNIFIGVTMKIIYLPIAIIIYVVTTAITYLLFLLWILLPLLTLIFLVLTPITS
jgi:hypothetical protein